MTLERTPEKTVESSHNINENFHVGCRGNGSPRLRLFFLIFYYIFLFFLTALPTASANPLAFKNNKESFHSNLFFIFFMNLPLNSYLLFYLVDKRFFGGYFLSIKRKKFDNEQSNRHRCHSAILKLDSAEIFKKFLLPSFLITLAGAFIDYFIVFFSPNSTLDFLGIATLAIINLPALFLIFYSVYLSVIYLIGKDHKTAMAFGKVFVQFNVLVWSIMWLALLFLGNISYAGMEAFVFVSVLVLNLVVGGMFFLVTARIPDNPKKSGQKQSKNTFPFLEKSLRKRCRIYASSLYLVFLIVWAGFFGSYFPIEPENNNFVPGATLASNGNATTNYNCTIVRIDLPVSVTNVTFKLKDRSGKTAANGEIEDICDANLSSPDVNLSFCDYNKDRKLSTDDSFLIKPKEKGGIAEDGFELKLKYKPEGGNIASVCLISQQ